jgi:hypothetical protein
MSVLIQHDVKDTVYSAFGATEAEAKANAEAMATELKAKGHHVRVDDLGSKLRDDLYGWSVLAKKIQYR